jgi:hypothetical protein
MERGNELELRVILYFRKETVQQEIKTVQLSQKLLCYCVCFDPAVKEGEKERVDCLLNI